MASTTPNRTRRCSPPPNEWPAQTVDENFRKSALTVKSPARAAPDCCCHGDERLSRRYEEAKSSGYRHQGGTQSDHELYKLSEERSSDEGSITETEINGAARGDVRPTYRSYESGPRKYEKSTREYPIRGYGKVSDSHQMGEYEKEDEDDRSDVEGPVVSPAAAPPTSQRNLRDYVNTVNLPQALIAMRKLERLKELQRRRDFSERYYSQEIKRLIGEHFFNKNSGNDPSTGKVRERRIADSGNRTIGDSSNQTEQRIRAGGFSKELEPCGTMTTITRLDCGCVRETTTPIFNMGHVKKCESHRYQTSTVPKLAGPVPQELTYKPVQPLARLGNGASSPTRAKARLSLDSATHQNLQSLGSRDLESWQDRRSRSAQPRIGRSSPRHVSPMRNNSPVRKYSETSSISPAE